MRVRPSVWLVALASALSLSVGVGATPASAAKKSPHLYVVPSSGLHNKQVVKVRGVHFKPGDTVYITECLIKAKGANGCDIATATPVKVKKNGKFAWTKFKVVAGKVGSGKCGTAKVNLKSCAVSAGNPSGGDSAMTRVIFALPKKK